MKKTLSIRATPEGAEAPALVRKGRGWKIAESRLDTLHETARERRRTPTEAQARLAEALGAHDLGKYRPRRQVVIGSAIVDFACHPLRLAIEIEEEGVDPVIERRRDRSLAEVGIKVLRYPAAEVLADAEGVATAIVAEMKARWNERRQARSASRTGTRSEPRSTPREGYRK